jgi:hypothetical protein
VPRIVKLPPEIIKTRCPTWITHVKTRAETIGSGEDSDPGQATQERFLPTTVWGVNNPAAIAIRCVAWEAARDTDETERVNWSQATSDEHPVIASRSYLLAW